MGRRGIGELHHHERRALQFLRAAAPVMPSEAAGEEGLGADFTALRRELASRKIEVCQPGARWVSDNERLLMGWLATLQRHRTAPTQGISAALFAILGRCAQHLCQAGIVLPCRAITHLSLVATPIDDATQAPTTRLPTPTTPIRQRRLADRRAQAIAMMRGLSIVSSDDFVASGVPLQMVNRLCREGVVERIHAGWYRPRPQALSEMAI